MKVFSVLFLSAIFWVSFASSSAFGQRQTFFVSSTDTRKLIFFQVDVTENNVTVKPLPQLNPDTLDIINTTLGESEDPNILETYFQTTDGTKRRFWIAYEDILGRLGKDPEALSDLKKLLDNLDGYSMQYGDYSDSTEIRSSTSSTATLDRIFIAGTKGTNRANDYFAFAFNVDGLPAGTKSTVFTNANTQTTLGGSISRDGSIAVQLTATSSSWTLTTRKLKNGVPAGAPFSWTVPAYSGYSPDITNAIEVNTGTAGSSATIVYYLVYRAFRNVGTASQQSQVLLQALDASGHPTGSPQAITPFKSAFQAGAEARQSLAIAPNGQLLFFAEYASCKKMILRWVRLTNGAASGAAKTAFGCGPVSQSPVGIFGMDIAPALDSNTPGNK